MATEDKKRSERVRRSERSIGEFYRAVHLPEGVDRDVIKATYADGVLEVTVPIPAIAEPKKHKVEVK